VPNWIRISTYSFVGFGAYLLSHLPWLLKLENPFSAQPSFLIVLIALPVLGNVAFLCRQRWAVIPTVAGNALWSIAADFTLGILSWSHLISVVITTMTAPQMPKNMASPWPD